MKKEYKTAIAILAIAGAIAGLIYLSSQNANKALNAETGTEKAGVNAQNSFKIRGIQKDDLVKGNKNADLIIVEYSDTECPFCKDFHKVMQKLVETHGDRFAWVYRHFPLDQLHRKARKEAEAVECAVKLAGPDVGFKYLDRIMEITPSNDGLDPAELPKAATYVELNLSDFNKCLEKRESAKDVNTDYNEAVKSGARGTPHNVLIYKGEQIPLPGAASYEKMKTLVEQLLQN